jgi:2-oxo-4-hydroxy-4-carboxy-5-ureidoimidazoline decarboxylase
VPTTTSIDQLNVLPPAQFVALLGGVFEHSAWVAERVWARGPFAGVDTLHTAMVQVMQTATVAEQLALLRAHPELAGREAQQGELTAASKQEQSRAGLNALTPHEMARIVLLNSTYQGRHGFPFVVCVSHHTKDTIFKEFERRADNATHAETQEALAQVAHIARLRLEQLLIN